MLGVSCSAFSKMNFKVSDLPILLSSGRPERLSNQCKAAKTERGVVRRRLLLHLLEHEVDHISL